MLEKLNQAIEYIEGHLTDNLSLRTISAHVGVSDYHFRTVFFYLANMSLSEYLKNRRLSEANKDLLAGERVSDVAYKYQYQSLDGFSRAFKQWSGFLPSEVVKQGISKSVPKMSFVITVSGGKTMDCRIVEKPAFFLVGVVGRVPMQFEGVNNAIVELAMSITEEQREEMHTLQDIEPRQIVNASYDADAEFLKEEGGLTHLIGVLTTKQEVSERLSILPVESSTWAVFPNEGSFPETMQTSMAKIYSEWLPVSGYEVTNLPTFSFTKMSEEKQDYAYSEVWLPVRKIL